MHFELSQAILSAKKAVLPSKRGLRHDEFYEPEVLARTRLAQRILPIPCGDAVQKALQGPAGAVAMAALPFPVAERCTQDESVLNALAELPVPNSKTACWYLPHFCLAFSQDRVTGPAGGRRCAL